MADGVLVHGIGQQQQSRDSQEAVWLPAIAGGVRNAGHDALADRIWRAARPGGLDLRMAFYGNLFRADDTQGGPDGELTDAELAIAEPIAVQWLTRYAEQASRGGDRAAAASELARLDPAGEVQGARAALRPVVRAVSRCRPFARLGAGMAERFVVQALRQVSRYFADEELRAEVQRRVLAQVGPETRVIVGHSLGSVVAYEVAHRLAEPLPLLVTLGSPLGLHTVVYERLRPQPPRVPDRVLRWVNVADRDDIVAAQPDLTAGFPGRPGVLDCAYTVDNGAKPHEATFYLTSSLVGSAIADAFAGPDE